MLVYYSFVCSNFSQFLNRKDQFRSLGIRFLRSPVIAHSNVKDHLALLEYIANMENSSENIKLSSLGFKGRSEDFNSQFGQPSLKAFLEFSSDLAKSLPHTMLEALVVDIVKEKHSGLFKLCLSNGSCLRAKAVVVSTGQGKPHVPEAFIQVANETPVAIHSSRLSSIELKESEVCVVGGGSSAALCAIKAVSDGAKKVVMIYRRELESRQFELRNEWLSPKKGLLHFEFFNQETAKEKLAFIRREVCLVVRVSNRLFSNFSGQSGVRQLLRTKWASSSVSKRWADCR